MKKGTPCGIPHGASLLAQLCLCMYVWPGRRRMGRLGRSPCNIHFPGSIPCAIPLTTLKIHFNLINLPDQRKYRKFLCFSCFFQARDNARAVAQQHSSSDLEAASGPCLPWFWNPPTGSGKCVSGCCSRCHGIAPGSMLCHIWSRKYFRKS